MYQLGRHLVLSKAPASYNDHDYITNFIPIEMNKHSQLEKKIFFFFFKINIPQWQ